MWMPADLASGGKATAGKAASMLMVNGLKTAGKKAAIKTAGKESTRNVTRWVEKDLKKVTG